MKTTTREDNSVLALLYDEHCRMYPTTVTSMERMIESTYRELYGCVPENLEQITAVLVSLIDEENRFAYEEGIHCGVRLALDLELESLSRGGATHVFDC